MQGAALVQDDFDFGFDFGLESVFLFPVAVDDQLDALGLAGGGVKSGCVYGATDDFGHRAVENPVLHTDYLATLLHLFGLSAEELTYTRNNQQLTILDNQPARVVKEILA